MKAKLICALICLLTLSSCYKNPCLYKNYCQPDYWGDTQFDIFGRRNCPGDTGHWVDENNSRNGYYCTSPNCVTKEYANCKDTCKKASY